ncbi:Solute carrier family 35 member F1 [Thelohanellus kitauei]|uniref:Solute carrier family 35 member F1 n=1 Tax=Thelohanellus kitauei TaxID=669202 RepID=A0A0C2N0A4_THEKT|nr:Solute carrier family 35 member F1 [Thelohanellus kitauei]
MCLGGCILYTLSNVLSEKFLQDSSTFEWLACVGLFSIPLVTIQGLIFQLVSSKSVIFEKETWLWIVLFIECSLIFYVILPILLNKLGAARVNLLITTSDLMAIIYEGNKKKRLNFMLIFSIILSVAGNVMFSIQTIYVERKQKKSKAIPPTSETVHSSSEIVS